MTTTEREVATPASSKPAAKSKSKKTTTSGAPAWVSVLVIVSLFVLWELIVKIGGVQPFILPAPTEIFTEIYDKREALLRNAQPTLVATGVGFGVGVLIGVVLAMLIAAIPFLKAIIYPVVIASQTTPKIALAPLFTLWFGIGLLPKVIIVALLVFFPVFINTAAGLESVSKARLDLMKSVNASRWDIYRHIQIPEAIPYFFAGLRLALTVAFIGVIVGEWIAAGRGLGYLLVLYNSTQDTAALFAVIFVFVFLATAAFYLLGWLENRFSWQVRIQRAQRS
ncbi:UNVERIFIED_ORG: NitT/TauT family transport system permease protein [Gordonia westfalica J30]